MDLSLQYWKIGANAIYIKHSSKLLPLLAGPEQSVTRHSGLDNGS
jgi:hypothetical protein